MRVAVIERFSDPSRNCDPNLVGAPGDEIRFLRLSGGQPFPHSSVGVDRFIASEATNAPLFWRCMRSLCGILTDAGLSSHDKRRLIASALVTGGAPLAGLAGAYDAIRLLRSETFDRIDCFSSRDFPLVPFLSRLFGVPYRDYLSNGTRYFGEFAFELLAVIPYTYWLYCTGQLRFTQACTDTRCLYYFSPAHEEFQRHRSYVPVTDYPSASTSRLRWDVYAFPQHLDTAKWIAPPYKSTYTNDTFRWPKELCIVWNKYTAEPSVRFRRAVNYLPVPVLLRLLELLTPRYQVVYVRPRADDIVGDHQAIRDLGEFNIIRAHFPDVLTIQQIHAAHPQLSFNELQLRLYANCERFVSVLGGSSFLASYFGGTNIVYAREGWEVSRIRIGSTCSRAPKFLVRARIDIFWRSSVASSPHNYICPSKLAHITCTALCKFGTRQSAGADWLYGRSRIIDLQPALLPAHESFQVSPMMYESPRERSYFCASSNSIRG
jgi:hypothetical protein